MSIRRLLLLMVLAWAALSETAQAQGAVTASIGNVFGGDAPQKHGTYAIAIGGGGAHGIGSELEFSASNHFFDNADGSRTGRLLTLMASVYVAVPINRVRPYGIFGFGFI